MTHSPDDLADEARERMEALQTIRRDFETQIEISRRSLKWLTDKQAAHLSDFLDAVHDAMGDDLFLAERLAAHELNRIECKLERQHERESAPGVL